MTRHKSRGFGYSIEGGANRAFTDKAIILNSEIGHLQEPFFIGIFSMTMADDAFYGGLVCIVSAKI